MCLDCGCGEPNERHGDDRHIVMDDIRAAAAASEISVDEAKRNIVERWVRRNSPPPRRSDPRALKAALAIGAPVASTSWPPLSGACCVIPSPIRGGRWTWILLMIPHQDTLRLVDDAITHLDQALAALGQIRTEGEQAITVDGIEHELQGLLRAPPIAA